MHYAGLDQMWILFTIHSDTLCSIRVFIITHFLLWSDMPVFITSISWLVEHCGAVLWLVKNIWNFCISDSDILFRISLTHAYRTHSYEQGFQKPTPGVATTIFLCPQRHYKNSWYKYTACQIKRFKAIWPLVLFCVWVI